MQRKNKAPDCFNLQYHPMMHRNMSIPRKSVISKKCAIYGLRDINSDLRPLLCKTNTDQALIDNQEEI